MDFDACGVRGGEEKEREREKKTETGKERDNCCQTESVPLARFNLKTMGDVKFHFLFCKVVTNVDIVRDKRPNAL